MKKDDPGPIIVTKRDVEDHLNRLVEDGQITAETRQAITVGEQGEELAWIKGVATPDTKK